MFFKRKYKRFSEPDNTAVFTTTFVVREQRPITYVTHEEDDGAWQFFSDDKFEDFEQVAMIVSLAEIVKMDPTLVELADMPVGHFAERNGKNGSWTIKVKKPF